MKTFRKSATGLAVGIIGLFFWNGLPDFRPAFAWILTATIGCYILLLIVQRIIRSLLSDELVDLRHNLETTTYKLDVLDRKLTVLLKDALEKRRQR